MRNVVNNKQQQLSSTYLLEPARERMGSNFGDVKTILSPNQRAAVKLKNLINFETHAIRELKFQIRYYESYFQRPIAPKRSKCLEAVSCLLEGILLACSTHAVGLDRSSAVFVILMENYNWSDIKGNPDAPYINHSLLPLASYAERYFNPPGVHPSEPNYLWPEGVINFGILNDDPPSTNHPSAPFSCKFQLAQKNFVFRSP